MYPAYAKWIQSHRDLPLKLNQWCNIVVSIIKAVTIFFFSLILLNLAVKKWMHVVHTLCTFNSVKLKTVKIHVLVYITIQL